MPFPGGKESPGVYQTIINQIPPHSTYIEAFAGGGAILRLKKPAAASIAIDIDPRCTEKIAMLQVSGLTTVCGDAISYLKRYRWKGGEFVYCDPPYLMETRLSKRRIYPFEFAAPVQHKQLLSILKTIPAMVMISSYWSELYFERLSGWRFIIYPASTRSTFKVKEYLWMNYPEPPLLHDYRYLGKDFREREKIKRQQRRWKSRLEKMNSLERAAILLAMEDLRTVPPKREGGACAPGDPVPSKKRVTADKVELPFPNEKSYTDSVPKCEE
jgi:DNA adenine methylase